jgi:hypothetical protein
MMPSTLPLVSSLVVLASNAKNVETVDHQSTATEENTSKPHSYRGTALESNEFKTFMGLQCDRLKQEFELLILDVHFGFRIIQQYKK